MRLAAQEPGEAERPPASPPLISFIVYGEPQPRGSKTGGMTKAGRRFYRDSNPKSYPWMNDVAQAAALAMEGHELLTGPLRVDLDFYRQRPKGHYGSGRNAEQLKPSAPTRPISAPDVLKTARGTLDAMEGIVYRNDAQIVEGDARKWYGTPERCEVRVTPL